MKKYRLCLAPLRFGAGLKGKIVDSWQYGLPVVTTRIGAEGMQGTPFLVKKTKKSSFCNAGQSFRIIYQPELRTRNCDRVNRGFTAMIEAYSPLGRVGDREDWGGTCEAETAASFVKDAVTLYSSEAKWNVAANAGMPFLSSQASFCLLCIQCYTIQCPGKLVMFRPYWLCLQVSSSWRSYLMPKEPYHLSW